jgi:hypothetical protein
MLPAMARTLYRIIRERGPTLLDFTSSQAQGIPPRSDAPDVLRLWDGLSCWATESQARRTIRSFPYLGSYIARLQIPDDAPVRIERTRGPGHHTVWGDPAVLMSYVVAVTSS